MAADIEIRRRFVFNWDFSFFSDHSLFESILIAVQTNGGTLLTCFKK